MDHSIYSSAKRNIFFWGSPGQSVFYCFHCFFKVPKTYKKRIIVAGSFVCCCAYRSPTERSQWVSPAFIVNRPFPMSTLLEKERSFILVDYAAIKCIIGSKVIGVMFHSRCRSCIKKPLFLWNANARKKGGVSLSVPTMLEVPSNNEC